MDDHSPALDFTGIWQAHSLQLPDGSLLSLVRATDAETFSLVPDVRDPRQMKFMHVPAYPDDDAARAFLSTLADVDSPGLCWLLRLDEDIAGWVALFNIDADMCELGYFVRSAASGRGVATAAARWVTDFAHRRGGVRRLNATTDPRNLASQRVLHACGFSHEGNQRANFHYGTEWLDTALFGRLADDPLPGDPLPGRPIPQL